MSSLRKVCDGLEESVCGLLLVSIVGLLFIQVVARYVFGQSISWAEEMSRFGLLGLVFISAAIGARKGTHIRITGHLRKLPRQAQTAVFALADLIWIAFNVVVVVQSVQLIISMGARPLISGALMLDMRWVFALIPIGFALQTIRLLERWWRVFAYGDPVLGGGEG